MIKQHFNQLPLDETDNSTQSEQLYSLSPKEDLNDKHFQNYSNYIRDALENNDIKNIAITGKYGSGKSSIINSYFKKNGDKDVLRVSFASFKSKKIKSDGIESKQIKSDEIESDEIENTKTEQGIINQILYQIKPRHIPLTNFKIKRPMTRTFKALYSFELLTFILIVSLLLKKDFVRLSFTPIKTFLEKKAQTNNSNDVLNYFSNLNINTYVNFFVVIFLMLLIWNTWSFLGHFQIHKFKLSFKTISADITLPNEDLFEKYIDEIIYIFQHSKKHILILEDIDRFEKIDIFQKLRELNIKLNINSKSKKQWKFIYLIKDDIFDSVVSDKALTRVKFFDLIIPVIPFVTRSNSYMKIEDLFKNQNISPRLVDILSNYIYDYRLLLNIKNEFTVFFNRLEIQDTDKLFALISYKNIYPDQFDELQNGEGVMGTFSFEFKKERNIKKENIVADIKRLKQSYKQNMANSEDELLALEMFRSDYKSYSFDDIIIYKNTSNSFNLPYSEDSNDTQVQKINEFMETDYFQKKLALATDEAHYYEQLNDLDEQLENIDSKRWQSISRDEWGTMTKSSDNIQKMNEEGHNLLFSLISNGFTDEHYLEVVNKYYGNINNLTFKRNLFEKQNDVDFNLSLSDIERLSSTLYKQDFDEYAILNFSLFKYYLETNQTSILLQMIDTSQKTESSFLENYLDLNPTDFAKIRKISLDKLCLSISHIKTTNILMQTIMTHSFPDTEQNVIDATTFIVEHDILNEVLEEILKSDAYISLKEKLISKSNKKYDVSDDFIPDVIRLFFKYDKIVGNVENFNKYVEMMDLNEPSFNFDNLLAQYFNKYYEDISLDLTDKEIFDSMLKSSLITDEACRRSFDQYKKHGLPSYDSSIINETESNSKVNVLLELGLMQFDNDVLEYINENNNSLINYYNFDFLISELVKTKYKNSKIDLQTINQISDYPDLDSFVIVSRNLKQYGSGKEKIISLLLKFTDVFDDARKVIKILENKKGAFQSHLSNDEAILNILTYLKDTNFVSDFQLVDDKYFTVKK